MGNGLRGVLGEDPYPPVRCLIGSGAGVVESEGLILGVLVSTLSKTKTNIAIIIFICQSLPSRLTP